MFGRFDADCAKYIADYRGIARTPKRPLTCEVGYERFFAPEIVGSEHSTPAAVLIRGAVHLSPIQDRVLYGGSTAFVRLASHLQAMSSMKAGE
jgi:actin-related protein 3